MLAKALSSFALRKRRWPNAVYSVQGCQCLGRPAGSFNRVDACFDLMHQVSHCMTKSCRPPWS